MLTGALGVFAVVRSVSGGSTWGAAVGGCHIRGPAVRAAVHGRKRGRITGCSLLVPVVALGWEALWSRRLATLVLFALLIAGLQTLYPLFLPPVVLAAAVAIAVLVIRRLRRGLPGQESCSWRSGSWPWCAGWRRCSRRSRSPATCATGRPPERIPRSLVGLPGYILPFNVLPGWVLQTREFYGLVDLNNASAGQFAMGALLPLLMVVVILLAVKRHREALLMLVIAAGASLLAYYTWVDRSCSYCVQRNLIPVGALAAPAIGLGLAAIATLRWRVRLPLAVAGGRSS